MINEVFKSLHESVKKRNTPEAHVLSSPKDVNVIHRGYIRNSAYPIKYDFVPTEKGKSKNEGTHVYRFSNKSNIGLIEINHKLNASQDSGHETTSTILSELGDFERDINLERTVVPAVVHHIKSHDPDIIKLKKGFAYTKDLLERIDPDDKIYVKTKTEFGTTLKKATPINDKAKRIISHIKSKLRLNNNKE
jgi:hypothetical protein